MDLSIRSRRSRRDTPSQWSHMLGVTAEARSLGLGTRLKLAQREATLAMGLDLVEWTYDPLQAANAHLNFAKLGVVVNEYEENIYGESSSPLHRGTPTDRFVAEWHLREPHVERRISSQGGVLMRDAGVASAPVVNPSRPGERWIQPVDGNLSLTDRRLLVEIPVGFSDMQRDAPDLALELAPRHPAHFSGVSRSRLSGRRFLPRAPCRTRPVSAGARQR